MFGSNLLRLTAISPFSPLQFASSKTSSASSKKPTISFGSNFTVFVDVGYKLILFLYDQVLDLTKKTWFDLIPFIKICHRSIFQKEHLFILLE